MIRRVTWIACLWLAACGQPPRSAAFFEANPAEAEDVLKRCKSGAQRGDECQTAEAGLAKAKNRALTEMFRRGATK